MIAAQTHALPLLAVFALLALTIGLCARFAAAIHRMDDSGSRMLLQMAVFIVSSIGIRILCDRLAQPVKDDEQTRSAPLSRPPDPTRPIN
jgi:hypothetical protein